MLRNKRKTYGFRTDTSIARCLVKPCETKFDNIKIAFSDLGGLTEKAEAHLSWPSHRRKPLPEPLHRLLLAKVYHKEPHTLISSPRSRRPISFPCSCYLLMSCQITSEPRHMEWSILTISSLNIVIDVVSAMDYLYHDCEPPIVNYDLKPGNVLLDEDMIARVGDFGLAKILSCNNPSQDQSSTIGFLIHCSKISRFSLDDKYSRQRVLLIKRFGLLPTQKPPPKY